MQGWRHHNLGKIEQRRSHYFTAEPNLYVYQGALVLGLHPVAPIGPGPPSTLYAKVLQKHDPVVASAGLGCNLVQLWI